MNIENVVEALQQVIAAVKEEPKVVVAENERFKKLSDGWVFDKALGVDWSPSSSKRMNWEEAKKYDSGQGGRLPTVKELRSLVDYDKHNPAIDTQFFKNTKTDDYYWTGTDLISNYSTYAWCVSFYYGTVDSTRKNDGLFVRTVRTSQCLIT